MNKYLLHGKLSAKEGNGEQLATLLLQASQLISTAPGCVSYIISHDMNDPTTVWITELWDSKADHDNSLQVAGVRELIAQATPLLAAPPQKGQELVVLGGKGAA